MHICRRCLSVLSLRPLLGFVFGFGFLAQSQAQSTLYYDRTGFLSDARVTGTTGIDFDGYSVGTALTGLTIGGVTFGSPSGSQLTVINGSTGVRFAMLPSTSPNVLSPGGSDSGIEDDDLELTFENPIPFFGIDVVFDVPDGASYVQAYFYDAGNNEIVPSSTIPAPAGAPGYQFVGLAADSALIKRVVFDEFDPTAADDHVAYDSLIFSAVVPEPSALVLVGLGVAAVASRLRRRV